MNITFRSIDTHVKESFYEDCDCPQMLSHSLQYVVAIDEMLDNNVLILMSATVSPIAPKLLDIYNSSNDVCIGTVTVKTAITCVDTNAGVVLRNEQGESSLPVHASTNDIKLVLKYIYDIFESYAEECYAPNDNQ